MPFSLRTVLHLLLVLALSLNGVGTAAAAARMQALHVQALVGTLITTTKAPAASQRVHPASPLSARAVDAPVAHSEHPGAAARRSPVSSVSAANRPLPCHTAAALGHDATFARPGAIATAARTPVPAAAGASGHTGAPAGAVAINTRTDAHTQAHTATGTDAHADTHCRDSGEPASAHAAGNPDCCGDGGCDCPCAQQAFAMAAVAVVRVAAVVHESPAPMLFAGRDAPALPHLIRPPIG